MQVTSISWDDPAIEILMNPRLPQNEREEVFSFLSSRKDFAGHVWVQTSGSVTSKWVALSKQALLVSALAVNEHLQSDQTDRWLNPLPTFHVGGLGIWARASMNHASVWDFPSLDRKWSVHDFCKSLQDVRATLTSLVPTQVYDVVKAQLSCPLSLRAAVVGGGVLREPLYLQARELGWPLLPSYGMTECASQIATASLQSLQQKEYPPLKILPHMEVAANEEGCLQMKSEALLSAYAVKQATGWEISDPKIHGWLVTTDQGIVSGESVHILGRGSDFIKIGGESVSLSRLDQVLDDVKQRVEIFEGLALVAWEEERLGHEIHLAVTPEAMSQVSLVLEEFHRRVLPFERIRCVHTVPFIPYSPLKKLLRSELLSMIRNSRSLLL